MNDFSVALLGDDQWARWGPECPELNAELTRLYTRSSFDIYNYGLADSRVGNALNRVCNAAPNAGNLSRSLSLMNPNVVLIESCAYSQFWDGPEGLSEYRDLLRRLWEEITRTTISKCLFCIAAPPPRDRFLEGHPLFINSSKATRARFADNVKMFLDEARSIAEDEGWVVADIGEEITKKIESGESSRRFFDQSDGAALSPYGFQSAAKILVRVLDNHRFIEERISK